MGGLLKLAVLALTASVKAGKLRATAIRMALAAVCAAFAALLTLAAIGCAGAALWIVLLPSLGAAGAPLVVAATLSGVVLILAGSVRLIARGGRGSSAASTSPRVLLVDATRLFNEHKGAMLLAAVVAGMAAANGTRKP